MRELNSSKFMLCTFLQYHYLLTIKKRQIQNAGQATRRKRELRAKTVALAFLFAAHLAEGEFESSSVDWEVLMLIWNEVCEVEGRSSWAYNSKGSSGNPAHQFSRDVKHALEAVRGRETRFTILGVRKRKPVN
jgi:hypothetical protein